MNPIRLIAKGTAQHINPASIGRATSGEGITAALAAGMCAGMPRDWWLAARLKWADDWSGIKDLELYLWISAVDIAIEKGWKVPKGREYLRKMARLAIFEMAAPMQFKQENGIDCDAGRAEFLGMDKSRYSRVWGERYEMVKRALDTMTSDAFQYLLQNSLDISATAS
ncbi:MAG: hypothetical protein JAY88_14670 [Candidatus Thiodiazotropha lotti]|nr:hypothetical protein [Candidatus Thiodiazotropha lotti]MCW4188307.1 hypothetical protein [Candidatus Thiodiazotropha lotti]